MYEITSSLDPASFSQQSRLVAGGISQTTYWTLTFIEVAKKYYPKAL
jgi:hypothetical protein